MVGTRRESNPLVIVTGASRGIGEAIGQELVHNSYRVISLSSSGKSPLDGHPLFTSLVCDLGDHESLYSTITEIIREYRTPFGLVNNAGVAIPNLHSTAHNSEISKVLRINLEAPLLLMKYFGRLMASNGRGRIVNISSITASRGYRGLATYAATKSGIEAATRVVARELGSRGVTVNCIAPGFIETAMSRQMTEGQLARVTKRRVLRDDLTPESIARVVKFLLSSDAADITGQTLTVDGGATI